MPGVPGIRLHRVAADLIEKPGIPPIPPPVGEAYHRLVPNVEGDPLLRHFAFASDSVAELVDNQVIGPGREAFFVAFLHAVALDTVASELHAQGHADTITGAFVGLRLNLDHGVAAGPHEPLDVALAQCFAG